MDIVFYAFAILLFAAVIFLIESAYLWWTSTRGEEAKRIERRLRLMSAGAHGNNEQLSILKQRFLSESPTAERLLLQVPRIHSLDRILEQSDIGWSVAKLFTYVLVTFIVTISLCSYMRFPILVSIAISILIAYIPFMLVFHARKKRMTQFEIQLPEVTDLISRSLRAGHAFPSAIQMVSEEMPDPVATEFRITFDEINYGIGMNEALQNLATRIPLTDLRYFVIAVLIQRESGGNLAEILGNISKIIRERLKLLSKIRVLSAEGKMSAWVLGLLPFAVGAVISVVNPKYMSTLFTDPVGLKMVGAGAVMIILGVLWMRSIIRIRV
ncbi:MAG: type II secretion system F family protein [Methylophilaceae bacterium]